MRFVLLICFTAHSNVAESQPRYNAALLDTLVEISKSPTPARYFAKLYFNAIETTNQYISTKPDSVKKFICGFESSFAPAFFRSYNNYINRREQEIGWREYYKDTSLNRLQYEFIGMNAHVNADMAIALHNTYDYDTLKKYKKQIIRFQHVLNKYFDSIYNTTGAYPKIKKLHLFTLGLDRSAGKKMILSWRKRQVRLALLYFTNPDKYKSNMYRLQKKRARWNRFAHKWIQ